MAAHITSTALSVGLGGIFRDQLINEQFAVAVWPLSETKNTRAKDITGNNNHGTYNGSGWTAGVSGDLPEGNLARTFSGTEYVEVLDDSGLGTRTLNLSLADGDVDIVFLIKTSTNDATNRAIVQKMVTDATGNGWSASLVSAAIRFRLEVAGVEIFNFDRGSIADNAWHLVHCNYQTTLGTGEARIYIDGAQSGATVTGVTTEPAVTGANLRIGCWNDGSGDFIGSLSYVMIGREGNGSLGTTLQATRAETDLIADVVDTTQATTGIQGSSILDNMARPGSLTFILNNNRTNSGGLLGYYTPGHANCRAGFRIGIPVKWTMTRPGGSATTVFRGRIKSIAPTPGIYQERRVQVVCADWMDVPASMPLDPLSVAVDQRSDVVFGLAVDQADGRAPVAVELNTGSSTLPFAMDVSDGDSDSILAEMTRIVDSERGYAYVRGNGTLVYEGRGERQLNTDLTTTLTASQMGARSPGLVVTYSTERRVNAVLVTITPRSVDPAATTVLYTLDISQQSVQIAAGQTIELTGSYTNPAAKADRVGGTAMVQPVASTDYAFWSNANGSGTDLTAYLTVFTDGGNWLGNNSFRVQLTNTSGMNGYLYLTSSVGFQLRGKGVYHYRPIVVPARHRAHIREDGPRTVEIELPYESSLATAEDVANYYLGILGSDRPFPAAVAVWGSQSTALLALALDLEIGNKVGIVEAMTAMTTVDPNSSIEIGYFINAKQLTLTRGRDLTARFTLTPGPDTGSAEWDESEWDAAEAVWGV